MPLFTYEYYQISRNRSNRFYQKHQYSPHQSHPYSPCRTFSAGHLTHSTTASVKAQLTQPRELNPLTHRAQQSLLSNSRSIKTCSLLSLNLTLTRPSLAQQMVRYQFPCLLCSVLLTRLYKTMLPNPNPKPNPSNTAIGDGDDTRETNPRRISKVARRKKILTGLLARRSSCSTECQLLGSSL